MRIHYLQHVPFEGLGSMESYLISQGHQLTATHLYQGQRLPNVEEIDWLIVMGGPMGVYDEPLYSWLAGEKILIKNVIDAGKLVLGICLGAQLIAEALGAKVMKNKYREIGWFPIVRSSDASQTILDAVLPQTLEVFHWHGDTFEIPKNAIPLASSAACPHQGFIMDNRVIGFQFHLETTLDSAKSLIANCGHELDGSPYVQTAAAILADESRFIHINEVMCSVLHSLAKQIADKE